MYENESWNQKPERDWTRAEIELDRHLERQEARARRELAEGLQEVRAFNGRAPRLGQTITVRMSDTWLADTLNGWLTAVAPKPAASAQIALSNESEAA